MTYAVDSASLNETLRWIMRARVFMSEPQYANFIPRAGFDSRPITQMQQIRLHLQEAVFEKIVNNNLHVTAQLPRSKMLFARMVVFPPENFSFIT
jgi:hypothetical protein